MWPTPKASAAGPDLAKEERSSTGPALPAAAALWQTPGTDSFRSRSGDRKDEMGLDQQARAMWPTPAARDYKGTNSADHLEAGTGRKHLDQLPNFVEHLWPTPQVADDRNPSIGHEAATDRHRVLGVNKQMGLRDLTPRWPTPTLHGDHNRAGVWEKSGDGLSTAAKQWSTPDAGVWNDAEDPAQFRARQAKLKAKATNGNGAGTPLAIQAKEFPSSHPDPKTSTHGEPSSQLPRKLNPLFVEWLMGWPLGWTALECSVEGLSRWQQHMRSALLSLPIPRPDLERQLSLL